MTRPYIICQCRFCRQQKGASEMRQYKQDAHRLYRRRWKAALRYEEDGPVAITMGYIA